MNLFRSCWSARCFFCCDNRQQRMKRAVQHKYETACDLQSIMNVKLNLQLLMSVLFTKQQKSLLMSNF